MSDDRFRQIEEVFNAARVLTDDARPAYLTSVCGSDVSLRAEVERLLAHDDAPRDFLRSSAVGAAMHIPADRFGGNDSLEVAPPPRIGAYRILRVLGQGGFGIVYLAEQDYPRRTVALKVIRSSIASAAMLRRFEVEAQILARLSHPAIAQIHEAGTERGPDGVRAFFVMEYVRGRPLDRYVEEAGLDVTARLLLVARICDAVQYAHQKGVIHRDLKPANILIVDEALSEGRAAPTLAHDEPGRPSSRMRPSSSTDDLLTALPKILDFGVARSTDPDIQTTTLQTMPGQLIGTLPYMSPEQVSGDPAEVDTRTDVYALGVILYQVLSGRLPHDLANCSIADAARRIRDESPPSLGRVNAALRGDVEAIVSKALEKEKARRYASAAELAADIRRHLSGHPVEAKGRSGLYVLRKTLVRHKWAATAVGAFLILLVSSSIALTLMYREASAQTVIARQERDKSSAAEQNALHEADRARHEERRARLTSNFLCRMLQSVDRRSSRGVEPKVRDVLDGIATTIGDEFKNEPQVEAAVRNVVGQAYHSLGLFDLSEEQLRRVVEIRRSALPASEGALGDAYSELAATLADKDKMDEAETVLREALAIHRRLNAGDERISWDLSNLGTILIKKRKVDEAGPLLEESMEIARRVPRSKDGAAGDQSALVNGLSALAYFHFTRGDIEKAEAFGEDAVQTCRQLLGEDHPNMAPALNNLAAIRKSQGRTKEALELYEQCLAFARKTSGPGHPDVANALCSLGLSRFEQGEFAVAEPLFREAVEIRRERLPDGHPAMAEALNCLGRALVALQRPAEAEPLLREALAIRTAALPAGDFLIGLTKSALGGCLLDLDHIEEAETLLKDAYQIVVATRGPTYRTALQTAARLAQLHEASGHAEEAEAWRAKSKDAPS